MSFFTEHNFPASVPSASESCPVKVSVGDQVDETLTLTYSDATTAVVNAISPAEGPGGGGTTVTLTGALRWELV